MTNDASFPQPAAERQPAMAAPSPARRPRRLPAWKRAVFSVLTATIVWGVIETASLAAVWWTIGELTIVRANLQRQAASGAIQGIARDPQQEGPEPFQPEIVHPYLGYVRRPRPATSDDPGISEYGFPGLLSPVCRREPGKVLVAVTGGSVAETLATQSAGVLQERLSRVPRFAGKQIVIVPLALLAYKQPQQLLALNYMLSLGAEYDVLINLDGFNELILPATSNAPSQLAPTYPWEWQLRVTKASDLDTLRQLGRITHLREATQAWSRRFSGTPLQYSPTGLLVWHTVHRCLQGAASERYRDFSARVKDLSDPTVLGPRDAFADDAALRRHCVEVWKRSSLQMDVLCRHAGIVYYHFLQPNQYLPESKPRMTDAERAVSIMEGSPAAPHVEQGYPLLIAAGQELRAKSVRFHELTRIFVGTDAATYSDSCCHLTAEGNRLLADAIARDITTEE